MYLTTANYVQPGDIIMRQRGTSWHPGENVAMGRDHTIYATVPGYVRFYKPLPLSTRNFGPAPLNGLPLRLPRAKTIQPLASESVRPHPSSRKTERRYIGVVLDRDAQLPRPTSAPRARLFDKTDLNAFERERQLLRRGIEPLALEA